MKEKKELPQIRKDIAEWEHKRDYYSDIGNEEMADRCQNRVDELYYCLWK